MAAALSVIQETIAKCVSNLRGQPSSSSANENSDNDNPTPGSSVFAEITGTPVCSSNSENPQTPVLSATGIARSIGLGVDPKIKAKIWGNEYVKLSSLVTTSTNTDDSKFKQVEQDGRLLFVKTNDGQKIKTISQWLEAFLVFLGIYCEKHSGDVGHLMTYARIVQGIAKSCGDEAAIEYDINFRQWRQADPHSCPWNLKNVELFQEAMLAGMDKFKFKKQPFRSGPPKQKYCFAYNNKGSCTKPNCTYPHICQYCAGKHPRIVCTKGRQSTPNPGQQKPNRPESFKKQTLPPKKD
jgi:hypothetical protein